jgi:membrane-associated phospholipid phosphatase
MSIRRKVLRTFLAGLALTAGAASASTVTDWNQELIDSIRAKSTAPPAASRQMAILHVAQWDAINALVGGFAQYHVTTTPPVGANQAAAVAGAGHQVLSALYPDRKSFFDAQLAADLAPIIDGTSETNGVAWGRQVADAILALRANDKSTLAVTYNPPLGAFWWMRTPPGFAPPVLPQWPQVTPWTMKDGQQFRPVGPPPTPSDPLYTGSWTETYLFGDVDSAIRTDDQTEIALFWNDGPGTTTPPGHWCVIAQILSNESNLSNHESARLFALISMAMADAAISAWETKYFYHHWRPVTGIQEADIDGNPVTFADESWSSLITTPPFPAYTSGHSSFSGAASRVLQRFFNTDERTFEVGSDGTPGVTREFESLAFAAEEAGQSRIYGGIHWQYDNRDGLAAGRAIGESAFRNYLRPNGEVLTCANTPTTLCLMNRFLLDASWRSGAGNGPVGQAAGAIPIGTSDGRFWFFSADNTEVLVKVLDGCSINNRYWVYASAATDVEYQLRVTDTETGDVQVYYNPLFRKAQAITDTNAFATCP